MLRLTSHSRHDPRLLAVCVFSARAEDCAAVFDVAAHGAAQVDRLPVVGRAIAPAALQRQAPRDEQDGAGDLGELIGLKGAEVLAGQDFDG